MQRAKAQKIIQAAAVLMRAEQSREMNYMRLIKLLYAADRKSLELTGRSITGDRVMAMEKGPVLSGTLDMIKGQNTSSVEWQRFFQKVHYRIEMTDNPGVSELSKHEIEILQSISGQYEDCDEWDLVEKTHKFEEWIKYFQPATSIEIPLAAILDAVGRGGDKDRIIQENQDREAFDQFFSQEPASDDLVEAIIRGAGISQFLPLGCRDVLVQQKLLEE